MPRTKKPAGTAADPRNGRRADLVVVPGDRIELPGDLELCDEAREQWEAYWRSTASGVQTPADRGVLLRWIDAVDRYLRTIAEADERPLVVGSQSQEVENPLYKIADRALGTVERCEKQLGIGALNRSGLGIAVITEQRSLADMNAKYGGGDERPDGPQASLAVAAEQDPRVIDA